MKNNEITNKATKVEFNKFYDKYDIKRYDDKFKELHKVLSNSHFYHRYDSLLELIKCQDYYPPYIYDLCTEYIDELEKNVKGLIPFLEDFEFIKELYDQVKIVLAKAKEIVNYKE